MDFLPNEAVKSNPGKCSYCKSWNCCKKLFGRGLFRSFELLITEELKSDPEWTSLLAKEDQLWWDFRDFS